MLTEEEVSKNLIQLEQKVRTAIPKLAVCETEQKADEVASALRAIVDDLAKQVMVL